jgi:hypothetical protein
LFDYRSNIDIYYPSTKIDYAAYDKNLDIYAWVLTYYSNIENKDIYIVGFYKHPNKEIRKAIENGNYIMCIELRVDISQKSILEYTFCKFTKNSNHIRFNSIDLENNPNIKNSKCWIDLRKNKPRC